MDIGERSRRDEIIQITDALLNLEQTCLYLGGRLREIKDPLT